MHKGFWWGNLNEGEDHSEDPGANGLIILKWILHKWDRGYGLDRSDSG